MLDEPSLGLAPVVVQELFERFVKINKEGTTVLLVEQNANMALDISDRGYVVENGRSQLLPEPERNWQEMRKSGRHISEESDGYKMISSF